MNTFAENGFAHNDFNTGQITKQTPGLSPDSGQDELHSSEDSLDSCEDRSPSYTAVGKKRTKFQNRSISDCSDEEHTYTHYKGILKHASVNRLRSLSESCAEHYNFCKNGESNTALDDWLEEEEEDDEDGENQNKVKKTVRFSDTVQKQLFRSNSSILGQRKKNQRKRIKSKKTQQRKNEAQQAALSSSTESEGAFFNDVELSDALDSVTLSDSGVEVEDSDSLQPKPQTKNKKQKRGKNNRRRTVSESNEMIFDLDL